MTPLLSAQDLMFMHQCPLVLNKCLFAGCQPYFLVRWIMLDQVISALATSVLSDSVVLEHVLRRCCGSILKSYGDYTCCAMYGAGH